jgi:phage terminase large subunit-like protein
MAGSMALACANGGASVAWIAPTYKQSRPLWRFTERMTAPVSSLARINRSEREVIFPNDGSLTVYSADSPDSIRGNAFDLVIIDEAARVTEEAWTDAIQPTLADRDGRAYLISTPKGRNWFYREFIAARADGKRSAAFTAPSSANPNPNIERAAELARTRVPERTYRQEWLAEFIDDGGGVFRRVRQCATATPQEQPIDTHVYVFGVDWARSNDYTVITVIDVTLMSVVAMDRFSDIDYRTQTNRLIALYERFKPTAIYSEANSMGGPLTEDLQNRGLPVYRFDTTAQTKPVIIQALELAFERESIHIIPDETLIGELESYEQERMASGIRYGAPSGGHDDCVMSLAIALHAAGRMGSIF